MSEQTSTPPANQADAQAPAETSEKPKRSYTRKDATTRAREARETAKTRFESAQKKYDKAVAEVKKVASEYEVARRDYAYKADNPLLAGDDVVQVPQALDIQSALVGAQVPSGIKQKQVAAETLVGSDGFGESTTSDHIGSEDYDADVQADTGSAIDPSQPSTHQV